MSERPDARPVRTDEPGRVGITAVKVPDHELVVDRDRVAAMREKRDADAPTLRRRMLLGFAQATVVLAAARTIEAGLARPIAELAWQFVGELPGLAFAFGVGTLAVGRYMARQRATPPEVEIARLQRDWASLCGPRWWVRPLKWGVLIGVGCTAAVGAAVLVGAAMGKSVFGGNPWMDLLTFLGLSLAWSIPAGFLFGWLHKRYLRRLMKPLIF